MFTINKAEITTERASSDSFSFLLMNAIQDILIEFNAIRITEIIKKVFRINEYSLPLNNAAETEESIINMSIVWK